MPEAKTLVQLSGISKSYGGVHALRGIDLEIRAGEVLAVCGENGAGKSTLNKILSGSVAPDSGSVLVDGQEMSLGSVQEAEKAGIAIVHQESAAFLQLTATENHQLMHEPVGLGGLWLDRAEMRRRAAESLASVGENFDPQVPLEQRSLAQRQMTAIARAVSRNCKLLILDEPTASLSTRETEALFSVIRKMRESGVAVV
jgi:ribose transport system ATP-binding protein